MKRIYTLALLCAMLICNATFAQSFSYPQDTVRGTVPQGVIKYHNDITNISSSPITLEWKVLSHTLPSGWTASGFGICDNVTCYASAVLNGNLNTMLPIESDSTSIFYVLIDGSNPVPAGTYYVIIQIGNTATNERKTTVYELTSGTTAIGNITSFEKVATLYPNPANNFVDVLLKREDVRTAFIIDGLGKVVSTQIVSSKEINFDTKKLSAGVYYLQLFDKNNNFLGSSKFLKN